MKKHFGISAGVHIAALLALIIGLPTLIDQEVELSQQIIPVDIVNVADVTNTKVSPTPTPKPTPAPTKTDTPKPQPTPEEKPKEPEPPKEPEKVKEPVKEDAEIIPDKTKPKEKEKPKEQPKPKPPEPKKEPKKEEPKNSLQNVLKNIEKLKDTPKPAPVKQEEGEDSDEPVVSNQPAALGQQLSISEMDALRRQIQQCWNVPVGARGIENMSVELYLEVNDDRTVRRVEVVDRSRLASDSYFRTVAESAIRAINNPKCSPLMLPVGKEDQWRKIRMNFNPKDML